MACSSSSVYAFGPLSWSSRPGAAGAQVVKPACTDRQQCKRTPEGLLNGHPPGHASLSPTTLQPSRRALLQQGSAWGLALLWPGGALTTLPTTAAIVDEQAANTALQRSSASVVTVLELTPSASGSAPDQDVSGGSGVVWDRWGHIVTTYRSVARTATSGQGGPQVRTPASVLCCSRRETCPLQAQESFASGPSFKGCAVAGLLACTRSFSLCQQPLPVGLVRLWCGQGPACACRCWPSAIQTVRERRSRRQRAWWLPMLPATLRCCASCHRMITQLLPGRGQARAHAACSLWLLAALQTSELARCAGAALPCRFAASQ